MTLLRDSIGDNFMLCPRVYPGNGKIKKRTPKSNLSGEPEGVKGAIGKPPCRARRRETPASGKAPLCLEDMQSSRAHLARQYAASWIKQLGGAPAGAQSYWQGRFAACTFVDFSFGMVARETVGALPQTPQGAPPLDPARGRRKGTKSPLDPFWLPGLGALPYFFFSFAFFS